jgi:hypothetical protein
MVGGFEPGPSEPLLTMQKSLSERDLIIFFFPHQKLIFYAKAFFLELCS